MIDYLNQVQQADYCVRKTKLNDMLKFEVFVDALLMRYCEYLNHIFISS